jgi:SOS-response transcriptional repressor LexA
MRAISPLQKRVLNFLILFQSDNGYCPSIQEMTKFFGFKSVHAILRPLIALEKKGFIKRKFGLARAITILPSKRKKSK